MLAVADVFVALKRLEADGHYKVLGFATEPDTWTEMAGVELRPDLYVEVGDQVQRKRISWWLEIDMGTERQKQIKDKLARYYHAWQHVDEDVIATFPLVVFLVPDEERVSELRWLISHGQGEARQLFRVERRESFPQSLLSA